MNRNRVAALRNFRYKLYGGVATARTQLLEKGPIKARKREVLNFYWLNNKTIFSVFAQWYP